MRTHWARYGSKWVVLCTVITAQAFSALATPNNHRQYVSIIYDLTLLRLLLLSHTSGLVVFVWHKKGKDTERQESKELQGQDNYWIKCMLQHSHDSIKSTSFFPVRSFGSHVKLLPYLKRSGILHSRLPETYQVTFSVLIQNHPQLYSDIGPLKKGKLISTNLSAAQSSLAYIACINLSIFLWKGFCRRLCWKLDDRISSKLLFQPAEKYLCSFWFIFNRVYLHVITFNTY